MGTAIVTVAGIEESILLIRGKKVLLDSDLARLYQVETKALMQAVRRNIERFPEDFMFQLTLEEAEASRSQIVTLKSRLRRHPPTDGTPEAEEESDRISLESREAGKEEARSREAGAGKKEAIIPEPVRAW